MILNLYDVNFFKTLESYYVCFSQEQQGDMMEKYTYLYVTSKADELWKGFMAFLGHSVSCQR